MYRYHTNKRRSSSQKPIRGGTREKRELVDNLHTFDCSFLELIAALAAAAAAEAAEAEAAEAAAAAEAITQRWRTFFSPDSRACAIPELSMDTRPSYEYCVLVAARA